MASTATDSLRLEKQGDGENDDTWGQKVNTALDLIDAAIAGLATVPVTGGADSLTSNNYAADEARCAIIKFTGTLTSNAEITIPSKSKTYVIWNATDGAYTLEIGTSGGTAVAVAQGSKVIIFCDGTDCYNLVDDSGSVTLTGTQTMTNKTLTNPAYTDQTLTDGATVDWNMNSGGIGNWTIGGNRTMNAPTNLKKGFYTLKITQDGTGGRTVTWNAVFKWAAGTAPVLSTAAGATDILTFFCDGTNLYGSLLRGVA